MKGEGMKRRIGHRFLMIFGLVLFIGGPGLPEVDGQMDMPDPRQRGKVMYPLAEVLLLCLLAVLAGAETICDIARFGKKKLTFLRRFLPFADFHPSPISTLRQRPTGARSSGRYSGQPLQPCLVARPGERGRRREHPRGRLEDTTRDTLPYRILDPAWRADGHHHPRSPGRGEEPALGARHGLPR